MLGMEIGINIYKYSYIIMSVRPLQNPFSVEQASSSFRLRKAGAKGDFYKISKGS